MRADVFLYENKYTESRARAKLLITGGAVKIDGAVITKPAHEVSDEGIHTVEIRREVCPYVSVGGLKLQAALDRFDFDVSGHICADIGASTGGFTDCLLTHGAARVYAVDSGTAQLHDKLRSDPRVISMENVNARYMTGKSLPERCSLAVCDVSFISLRLILPAIQSILTPRAYIIALIKPQFELDRAHIGRGIVTNADDRVKAVYGVIKSAAECGLSPAALTLSPISGGEVGGRAGNHEYLILFHSDGETGPIPSHAMLKEFIHNEKNCDTAVWHKGKK